MLKEAIKITSKKINWFYRLRYDGIYSWETMEVTDEEYRAMHSKHREKFGIAGPGTITTRDFK